ncbi:uncharacterized protein N7498_003781 [Penicillium cinerascens]|uniref:Arb2 domain-containing protein n=1 Tax=Penicillium cinerascens TaxID=70096 RepID=A0A9W9T879_9EURO|nr:uncharacterized protein N7498_003781 [Penicillium cinerascens]KAJ5212135.1 hypothetical protein N7498_003781 [Penicillium cinerascens]
MFVYRNKNLPPDPEYPVELKKLGYFITEKDLIRQTANPEAEYKYKINRNDRFNIKHREAMNEAVRGIVLPRLEDAGLKTLRLPHRDGNPPRDSFPTEAHVPILISPNLSKTPRILVVFGEPIQDLGIWSHRTINRDGINIGSAVDFTKAVLGEGKGKVATDGSGNRTDVALILANTGQLLWHCATSRAITTSTWLANPRPAGNYDQAKMSYRNMIPGNKDWREHVAYVFEKVLWKSLGPSTRVDIIGMSEGGLGAINYLTEHWEKWRPYISAMCLADPLQSTNIDLNMAKLADSTSFPAFMSSRCRAYIVSQDEADKPQIGYRHHGCKCYSSGETQNSEGILPRAWPHMLAWLDILYRDRGYAEVEVMGADVDEVLQRAKEGLSCKAEREEPEEPKEDLIVEKGVNLKLASEDDDSKDRSVSPETQAEDVRQDKTVKSDDTKEIVQNEVAGVKGGSPKDMVDPSVREILDAMNAAFELSDDGYFGDVEEMGSFSHKRETSSETDTL